MEKIWPQNGQLYFTTHLTRTILHGTLSSKSLTSSKPDVQDCDAAFCLVSLCQHHKVLDIVTSTDKAILTFMILTSLSYL